MALRCYKALHFMLILVPLVDKCCKNATPSHSYLASIFICFRNNWKGYIEAAQQQGDAIFTGCLK